MLDAETLLLSLQRSPSLHGQPIHNWHLHSMHRWHLFANVKWAWFCAAGHGQAGCLHHHHHSYYDHARPLQPLLSSSKHTADLFATNNMSSRHLRKERVASGGLTDHAPAASWQSRPGCSWSCPAAPPPQLLHQAPACQPGRSASQKLSRSALTHRASTPALPAFHVP